MKKKTVILSNIALSAASVMIMGFPFHFTLTNGIESNPIGFNIMFRFAHAGSFFMWLLVFLNVAFTTICLLRLFTTYVPDKANTIIKLLFAVCLVYFTTVICFSNYSLTGGFSGGYTLCGWAIYTFAVINGINAISLLLFRNI